MPKTAIVNFKDLKRVIEIAHHGLNVVKDEFGFIKDDYEDVNFIETLAENFDIELK